jgi:hypothetical protein
MGKACGTSGEEGKYVQGRKVKERDGFEDLDGRISIKNE